MSASPMHLAAAYAAIANGGVMVKPTLLKRDGPTTGVRVMSREDGAECASTMLRRVVTEGTASLGEVRAMRWRARPAPPTSRSATGGYYEDKVINTFASVFPAIEPAICADRHAGRAGGHHRVRSRAAPRAGRRCRSRPRSSAASRRCWGCGPSLNPPLPMR